MSLAVIIPSKNATNFVPCAEAVRRHEPDAPIVLVDDGMDLSWIPRDDLEPVVKITGEQPFIFARNINAGIRAAITCYNADGFVLLNDDALLETPGGFSVMERAARDNPSIGIIGATCNNIGNPNQFNRGIGLRGEDRMVCFVCVYLPLRTIKTVGFLDERYTKYGMDDDDMCFEIRKAGLEIAIHDGCFVDHSKLHSSFRGPAGAGGDFRHNLELFKQKWGTDNWGRAV